MFSASVTTLLQLASLLLLASPVAAVGCYSRTGQTISAGAAAAPIAAACSSLAGSYLSGQTNPNCQNVDGFKINFQIALASGTTTTTISYADCVAQNSDTAAGCAGYGGIRQFGEFQLTFDPNSGSC